MQTYQIIDDFKNAMREAGIEPPLDGIKADGELHRFHIPGQKHGRMNGAYKLHIDGVKPAGYFEDFKTGIKANWKANGPTQPLTHTERENIKTEQERRERERKAKQDETAKRARKIWQSATPAPIDHPYLQKKQIKPHGAKIADWSRSYQDEAGKRQKLVIENALLIPLYNESGIIRNLQAIFPSESPELGRGKDFLPLGEMSGLFWWLGEKSNPVCIAEGFATAATIHEQTGYRVYIAFTAGNLMAVGEVVRKHLSTAKIIFCADNDEKTPGNPGLTKANEAAAEVGGFVAVPLIDGDFNDYQISIQEAQ